MAYPATALTGTTSMVTGFFRDHDHAERAMAALARLDYKPKDISIMTTHGVNNLAVTKTPAYPKLSAFENRALEGAGLGGALGGTIGALLAAIVTIGTMVLLPGTGVIIAGPVVAAFAGAGAGGLLGGLIGVVIGGRMTRERMKTIDQNASSGGILMSVVPHNEADKELIERELVATGSDLVHR